MTSVLRITTDEINYTRVATVWVGEVPVVRFRTGTRDSYVALETATEILADALRPALTEAVGAHPWTDIIEEAP